MSNSLKINAVLIPEEGQNFVFSEDGAWFKECFQDSKRFDFNLRKVDVNCMITKNSGTFFIIFSLSVAIYFYCCRCFEETNLPIGGYFAYTLVPAKAET